MKNTIVKFNSRPMYHNPKRPDPARFGAALKLIAEKGMPVSTALRAAGYSRAHASKSGNDSSMKPLIISAQEQFVKTFMSHANKVGLTPEKTVDKLNTIVDAGDFQEQTGAIREFHKVILTTLAINARGNSMNIGTINQNFLVPPSHAEDKWKSAAIEAQAEESAAARTLESELESERSVPARTIQVKPESWRAGRSNAIKRGHATRKRKALKAAHLRRLQARRPRTS